ncbi:MAG: membrane dipeptidase [Flavobacteriales bacterium]|nr:membrane dipeptidase [Flavobacteriales bacterium]
MVKFLLPLFLTCLAISHSKVHRAQPVNEFMDLQIHPTMHIRYGFFGNGLEWISDKKPKLKYKHLLTNVNYADYFYQNKGARIFVIGLIGSDSPTSRKKAQQSILDQMSYVERFVAENADKFSIGRTAKEVRQLVNETDKTVFIFSIEGAKKLISSMEDAEFWAEKGIAYITPIHLEDCEYGGAGIRPGLSTNIINIKGVFRKIFIPKKRGLTPLGKQAISWMYKAGMMVDVTHMTDQSRHDALDVMGENGFTPLATHDHFKPFYNKPRSIDTNDVIRIYQLGGYMSLACNGYSLIPKKPYPEYKKLIKEFPNYESGTIDTYQLVYETLLGFIRKHYREMLNQNTSFSMLTEQDLTRLSVGMQSDFNGWVNHTKPKYGSKKAQRKSGKTSFNRFDLEGLPHPGYLNDQWEELKARSVDLNPILRSSERFLQIWEKVQSESTLKP